MRDDIVNVWCRILQESEAAVQIEVEDAPGEPGGKRRHWLLKSQLPFVPDPVHWPRPLPLQVPFPLARAKGLV